MNINVAEYRDRVLGCWMGKNIGGTICAPMEWRRQVNDVSFYTQELSGEALPNDDLDIQLLWLVAMEEKGTRLDVQVLADYWLTYVTPHWSEYGICKSNLRNGLCRRSRGHSTTATKTRAGRSSAGDLGVCLPGLASPGRENGLRRRDHRSRQRRGNLRRGVCAAIEAAAFVERDLRKLIDIGLTYIPADCAVADVVKFAIQCHVSGIPWLEVAQPCAEVLPRRPVVARATGA